MKTTVTAEFVTVDGERQLHFTVVRDVGPGVTVCITDVPPGIRIEDLSDETIELGKQYALAVWETATKSQDMNLGGLIEHIKDIGGSVRIESRE